MIQSSPTLKQHDLQSLKDISAVVTISEKDLLFYVNQDYSLTYYESQTPDESKLKQYLSKTIDVGGDTIYVNKELPLVSAVAYKDPSSQKEEASLSPPSLFSSAFKLPSFPRLECALPHADVRARSASTT